MREIARESAETPDLVLKAPHTTPVKRVDEVGAARNLVLRWKPAAGDGKRVEGRRPILASSFPAFRLPPPGRSPVRYS